MPKALWDNPDISLRNGQLPVGQPGYQPAEWTITVINSGAGSAFNVEVIETLGADLKYLSSSWSNSTGVTTYPNKMPDPDATVINGASFVIKELAPGEKRFLTFKADIYGCETTTNKVEARVHCLNATCQTQTKNTIVLAPPTKMVVATIFENPGNSCSIKKVYISTRNAGLMPVTNISLNQILPAGLTYIPGSFAYRVSPLINPDNVTDAGGVWIADADADPDGAGTAASPYIWDYQDLHGTLPPDVKSRLLVRQPGDIVQIRFDVYVGCDFTPGQLEFFAEYEKCGSGVVREKSSTSVFNVVPNKPILTVTKTADKSTVTCGNVKWNLIIKNEANGTAGQPVTAQYTLLKDVWGTGFNSTSGTPVVKDSGGTTITTTSDGTNAFTWELLNLAPNTSKTYTMEAILDKCTGTFDNTLIATSGCNVGGGFPKCFICKEKGSGGSLPDCPQVTTTVTNDTQSLAIDLVNPNVNACADDQVIQVRLTNNSDLTAIKNPSVDIELPSGVTYLGTPAPTVSPIGTLSVVQIGQTLKFTGLPDIPGKNGGAAQSDIITFHVSVACVTSGQFKATPHFDNCCNNNINPGIRNLTTNWQHPDLVVKVTPDKAIYECGETVDWTFTVTNNGPVAAEMVRVWDIIGAGLSFPLSAPTNAEFYETAPNDGTKFTWTAVTRRLEWEIGNLQPGAANARTYHLLAKIDAGSCTNPADRRNLVSATWHCVTGGFANEDPTGTNEGTCTSNAVSNSADASVAPNVSANASIAASSIDYCDKTKEVTITITNGATSNTLYDLNAVITLPTSNGTIKFNPALPGIECGDHFADF